MFSGMRDMELINNLKRIVELMEENMENKRMLYTFMNETNKVPVKCNCEIGTERVHCTKCKGTGYYLVDKGEED